MIAVGDVDAEAPVLEAEGGVARGARLWRDHARLVDADSARCARRSGSLTRWRGQRVETKGAVRERDDGQGAGQDVDARVEQLAHPDRGILVDRARLVSEAVV